MNQTANAVNRMRQEALERAMRELAGRGVNPESEQGLKDIMAAQSRIDDEIWAGARQHSLSKLRAQGIAGIEDMGEDPEYLKQFGGERFVALDDELDGFAALQADQFLKGMQPISYEDWKKANRGPVKAAVENVIGHAIVGFEGMVGIGAAGGSLLYSGFGPEGLAWNPEKRTPEGIAARMQVAKTAMGQGQRMGRDIATLGLGQMIPAPARTRGYEGVSNYIDYLAGEDPTQPVMSRERFGDPAAFGSQAIGAKIGEESSNIGSALGTIPFSLPSMLAPNLATQAVATAPFALAGYADAQLARWDIYEQQVDLAERMGIEPPPAPTFAEMETLGATGGFVEWGGEFLGDTIQSGAIRMMGGKRVGGKWRFGSSKVGNAMREVNESLMRSRGLIGQAKRLGFGVAVGAATEGILEEGLIPNIGVQLQDLISNSSVFKPEDSFWSVDRPFFDFEAGEFGFLAEDVWTEMKIGSYAGGMTSSGFYGAQRVGDWRQNRAVSKEIAKGGTGFLTEAMVRDQEREARSRVPTESVVVGGKEKGPASRRLTEGGDWRRGATTTRGSAMAMHHIEEMASEDGMREIMLVDPSEMDMTLTKEVKRRMRALGISTKPIGTIDGRRVFAPLGTTKSMLERIRRGEIGTLVGNPMVNEGDVVAGMVVFRDGAGRVVDTMPYSDPKQMEASAVALQEGAARRGLTMEVVNEESASSFGGVEEQVRRQMDADAADAGRPQIEQRPVASRDEKRGMVALKDAIHHSAIGSKRKGPNRNPKPTEPFTSKFLTPEEIGDATNADVTVTVTVNKVSDDRLSVGERNIIRATRGQTTVVEPKIVYSIKRKDGTVQQIEKEATPDDGAYLPQASPDGLYLIRENGTAFTARNAFMVAMHEMRHRTMSRSRAGAKFLARLLQIDPVYALRGGADYMRRMLASRGSSRLDGMSDAQMIAYYRGLSEAAEAVERGTATAAQAETVQKAGGVAAARAEIGTLAAESVTTTANRAMGQTARLAVEYDTLYRDSQERSFARFSRWMASVLVRNGFAGPEAQQMLFEMRQRLDGVREEELQIHRKFSDRVAETVRKDLEEVEKQRRGRAMIQATMGRPTPAAAAPAGAAPAAATPSEPAAAPTAPEAAPAAPAEPTGGAEPRASMRMEPSGASRGGGGGLGEDQMDEAAALIEQARAAPPEERSGLLSRAVGIVSALSQATAQIAPSSNIGRPQTQRPSARRIPESLAQPVTGGGQPQPIVPQYSEETARRQRNAQNAMAIIEGDEPTEPVDLGTVARIQRARTFYQTPDEEIRSSVRDRVGRRPANDEVRSIRRQFMAEREIVPQQEIEETYSPVDEDFAKRVADWYENTPVDYEDPQMLAAYQKFAEETTDQYQYLRDRGYDMIPWAGEGQPYADSEDMIEDLRQNKRVFYYKTVNPQEVNSFGSNPEAFQEALRKNPLLKDSGIEVLDSEGQPYRQTVNDLFRGVHDILGHGAEGFQFGPRGEENAYRSHAVMFSPLARSAMATETRVQNSWVNFGPNRRNPDGSVWGKEDPRYEPWIEALNRGEGFADQKPLVTPPEFLELYEAPRASMREGEAGPFYHAIVSEGKGPKGRIVYNTPRYGTYAEALESADDFARNGPQGPRAKEPFVDVFRVEDGRGVRVEGQRDAQPESDEGTISWKMRRSLKDGSGAPIPKAAPTAPIPQAAPTPQKQVAKLSAAERRAASAIKRARLNRPAISVSAEVTADPFINPNIIIPAMKTKGFSKTLAYRNIADRMSDLIGTKSFKDRLSKIASAFTNGSVTNIESPRSILGSYMGRVETSMRISIPDGTHDDHVSVSKVLGSLLLQEATITISPPDASTALPEQGTAVLLFGSDKMKPTDLKTLLAAADSQLGGASTTEDGTGVWAVYTPYEGNPLSRDQFLANARALAAAKGKEIAETKVRSTYTVTGDLNELGRTRPPVQGDGDTQGDARTLGAGWNLWIDAAADIVEALRDEGFDINIAGWVGKVAGRDAAAVERALVDVLAERSLAGKHGLSNRLITAATVTAQRLLKGFKIPAKTTASNADASFAEVDALIERHPNALRSRDDYQRFLVDLFKSRSIPILPEHLLRNVANNFDGMRREMNLRENGGRLTRGMVKDAIHGLEMAQRMRGLYAVGKVKPVHTVMLMMWGFMSRGVSPMIQESLFLDMVNFSDAKGRRLSYFVDLAMENKWTVAERDKETKEIVENDRSTESEWRQWVVDMFTAMKYDMETESGEKVLDKDGNIVTRNGSAGSGANHNANAFGVSFLANIGKPVKVNGDEQAGLTHLHRALADPKQSGKDVRRVFARLGGGLGIDNKVVGFASLVAGKTDIQVMDRVRVRDHYDRDGDFPNIYDGYTIGYEVRDEGGATVFSVKADDGFEALTEDEQREKVTAMTRDARAVLKATKAKAKKPKKVQMIPIRIGGIANLFNGARGIALYEIGENSIDPNAVFSDLMKVMPEIKPFVNHGAEHWLNWVGASGQEASHKTLEGLIEMIASGADRISDVFAKEGRYDTYSYGAEYGYVGEGDSAVPEYRYEFNGTTWRFDAPSYGRFIKSLSNFDWVGQTWKRVAGQRKPKFLVGTDPTTGMDRTEPWYRDEMVGQKGASTIEQFADQFGTRMSMRSEVDAVTDKMAKAILNNSTRAQLDVFFGATEMARVFAKENIGAETPDEAHALYKAMVVGKWPKPTTARFVKYFDRDNALNGIVPNDVWWHGGRRRWTTPDYDVNADQFGLHIGNFDQGSHFFREHRKSPYIPMSHEPVLFALYATARKPLEIMDMGYWQPEMILRGMEQVGVIDRQQHLDAMRDMYRSAGLPSRIIEEALRLVPKEEIHPLLDSLKTANMPKQQVIDPLPMLYWMRETLDDMGYDAIRYPNYIEGKQLSPYRLSAQQRALRDRDEDIAHEEAEKQKATEYYAWAGANQGASGREKIEAMKAIRGDKSSLVLWNTGQVKSASAREVGFNMLDPDIRASMRVQPLPLELSYPDVFGERDARFSVRDGVYGRIDEEAQQFIDRYDSLRRYGEIARRITGVALPDIANPYLGARLLQPKLAAMQKAATRQYADILRDQHESGITLAEMDEFLTAQHALNGGNAYIASKNPAFPDGGTGMLDADAQAVIQRAIASRRFGDFNRLAEDWRTMLRAGLAHRRANGLITQETYDILTNRYTHYVPLRGAPVRPFDEVFEDFEMEDSFGRGISTSGRGMPRRYGRQSEARGVTSQVGFLHEDTFRRVQRNEIAQRFLRLAMLVNDRGMAEFVRPRVPRDVEGTTRYVHDQNWMDDERHFGVYIAEPMTIDGHDYDAGDLVIMRLNNPRLVEALNSPELPLSRFMQALAAVTNAWKFMTTGMGNPFFPPVNAARDLQQVALNNYAANGLRDTMQVLRRWPSAFAEVFREEWFRPDQQRTQRGAERVSRWSRFVGSGAHQMMWRGNDLDVKRVDFEALAERVTRRDPTDRGLARTLLGWYPAFFTAAENAARLAVFEQRLATGSGLEQSALAARDSSVDFAKGGRRKKSMNIMYAFINASIQGSVNTGRALRQAAHIGPSLFMFGMINAMLARAMSGEDEERGQSNWDNEPDYIKSSNMLFFDPRGTGKHIKIPLSYGYNVFYSAGVRVADAAFGNRTAGDVLGGILTDAMNSFNPMGGSGITEGVGPTVAAFFPTMARPLIEHPLNQNWMGRPIYPEQYGKRDKADSEMYFPNTPEPYITAAQSLNELTGGDAFEGGVIDWSPNSIQYLVGYYLSGTGRNAEKFVKMLTNPQETETADIPLVRSFFGDSANNTRALSEQYNQIATRVNPDMDRLAALRDSDTDPIVRDSIRARGVDPQNIALGGEVKRADKVILDVRRRMKDATPEQREALLKVRERAMKRVIRESNRLTEP